MAMRPCAIDVETTARSPDYPKKKGGKVFGAWPFYAANEVVQIGICETLGKDTFSGEVLREDVGFVDSEAILCTHNGKFDFHYIRKSSPRFFAQLMGQPVWDTQIAEYIITGQMHQMASLDELALKYGQEVKDEEVKEHFKSGGGADTIDPKTLHEYLMGDITATRNIAQMQMAKCSPEQVRLILQMGEAMKAACEMEWNGFQVDTAQLDGLGMDYRLEIDRIEANLQENLADFYDVPTEAINVHSLDLWRMFIFGGKYTFKWKTYDGFYKTGDRAGQPKPKNVTKEHEDKEPILDPTKAVKTPSGEYAMDESILGSRELDHPWCKKYLELKKLSKLLNTYVNNILDNCAASHDGRLHHNLNLTTASTGRTSCSDPNMQNTPTEATDLKSCFVSRWGEDGVLVEADFKALEMVGFATVNPDPQLIDDLNNGRDPHTETGKAVFPHEMTELERRQVKGVNFGTIYGGGSKAVADNAGIDEKLCKKIQKALKHRYAIGFAVAKDRQGLSVIEPIRTGRKYVVNGEYTKTMNYPVQGFSTGDLVPTVQGVLWAKLQENDLLKDSCLLLNQEHDKFIFDVKVSVLEEALPFIKETMEAAPEIMEKIYGVKMPCRTPVSIKVGRDLGHMEKL
jgi:DNA polymerase I-like protein with 3'-5' exonuclease and polymerase domains